MNTTTVQVRLPNIYHVLNTARSEYRTSIRTLDNVLVKNRMRKIVIAVLSGQFENRTDDNFGFGIQNIPYSDARYKILYFFLTWIWSRSLTPNVTFLLRSITNLPFSIVLSKICKNIAVNFLFPADTAEFRVRDMHAIVLWLVNNNLELTCKYR